MADKLSKRIEALQAMQSGKYDDQTTIRMTQKALNMPLDKKIWVDKCGMVFLNIPFGNQFKNIVCAYPCIPYVDTKLWDDHEPKYLYIEMITKVQSARLYSRITKQVKYLTLHFAFQCKLSDILFSLHLLSCEGKTIKLVNVIKDCDVPPGVEL